MNIMIQEQESIIHPCVYKDDSIAVYIENASFGWCIHCYVTEWSKEMFWKFLGIFKDIKAAAPDNSIYAVSKNSQLTKFAKMFGFMSLDTLYDETGKEIGEFLIHD